MYKKLTIIALLASSAVFAGEKPKETPTPAPTSESASSAVGVGVGLGLGVAGAKSGSESTAVAGGGEGGNVGNIKNHAEGGAGGKSRSTSDSSADNAVSVNSDDDTTVTYPRQVPPVILPTLIVADCGAGGSVGGADKGAAAAVSALFTPQRCYALRAAATSFAVGDYEGGCQRLAYVTRKIDKKMGYVPNCKEFAERLTKEAEARAKSLQVDTSKFITRDEQNERDRRLIETVAGK